MVEFAHNILDFLQRNHFTDAEAALRSELLERKSTSGWGSLNDSSSLSTQGYGGGHNENYSREQRTELRDAAYLHIKSCKPNNLTACMTSEKEIAGTLKDESNSYAERLRSPPLSSKALSNKQTDSELKGKELDCYSSKHGSYGEFRDANSERPFYGNERVPLSVNGYADGVLGQYISSSEQRKLQDLAGDVSEMLMFKNDHTQFGNGIDYSPPGDPKLGLSGISSEKTRIIKGSSNNVIEEKGNFYETQDEEILPQDTPDVQHSPRNIHSTEDLRDQIEAIPKVDGDNHASNEGNQNLRLHGKENNYYFSHDKKTSGPQIANTILDVEANMKSYAKFDQGREESFQEAVLAHENGEKISYIQEHFGLKTVYRTSEHSQSNFGSWKGGPLKTAFPFSLHEVFLNNEQLLQNQAIGEVVKADNEGIGQGERKVLTSTNKGVGEEGAPTRMLSYQSNPQQKNVESPELSVNTGNFNELFPRFSSKTFQLADYSYNFLKESFDGGRRTDSIGPETKSADMESSDLSGPYFHIPGQQEIRNSGKKPTKGSRQGSNDYLRAQRDSGIYDDDNDLDYIRQPVDNDAWLFSREIYYPTENEHWSSRHGTNPNQKDSSTGKNEHDNQPFAENLYFSEGRYFPSNNELKTQSENPSGLPMAYDNDGKLIGNEETNSLRIGPEWQGFAQQRNGVEMLCDEGDIQRSKANNIYFVDHHKLVRSTSVGSFGEEDASTNVRRNHIAGITEGLSLYEYKLAKYDRSSSSNNSIDRAQEVKKRKEVEDRGSWRDHRSVYDSQSGESDPEQCFIKDALKERPNGLDGQNPCNGSLDFGGLLFPPSSSMGDVAEFKAEPEKSFLSNNRNMVGFNGKNYYGYNLIAPDVSLIASRRKSNESLTTWSERDGDLVNELHTMPNIVSTNFNYENVERMGIKIKEGEKLNDLLEDGDKEEDEEAASLGQLIQQMKTQQDQFETFDLQIVHRRNRTGYEEVKDYHAVLNTVIAGRYHVIQNLGSAVFSNVVQVHDLHTGMDACLKIIKNNKEYFDQSLDEIKLLNLVNRHDPADKYHLLRVYDYFYHREHMFIVCELLKANLYEFYKFNRESGGEAYFTMPRLQSIAIQCLEALQFLHNLGIIHCDLKPENILMKSFSRCEVKVIDLGSSCFETDLLCLNVQSRSYRAPEVILGLPYDKKIDVWSLGCILAELFLGNVLFQSDSSATLLASIIAIVGPIDKEMLVMGCDTHKYFTKSYVLYERNQDTNAIEFLTLKRTSLKNILAMGDQGFLDFVSYILEINPKKRPTASAALQHPWLSHTYEPISS